MLATIVTGIDAKTHYSPLFGAAIPINYDNYTKGLIQNANENPNATRSVNFKPFQQFSDYPDLQDVYWTWREHYSSV